MVAFIIFTEEINLKKDYFNDKQKSGIPFARAGNNEEIQYPEMVYAGKRML